MSTTTRRDFLATSSAVGGSLLLTGTRASGAIDGASNRVRIAVAGVNGRGQSHLKGWLGEDNVEVAYVIDPDARVRERTMASLEKRSEGKFTTKAIRDVREALDDPSLDAISIATPNHWHSLMTIWGAQAGKHVYVEKPMS
ncbi:MAG: Gfo/Idh/MocA family protein, partial [Rubripirellula sp.]